MCPPEFTRRSPDPQYLRMRPDLEVLVADAISYSEITLEVGGPLIQRQEIWTQACPRGEQRVWVRADCGGVFTSQGTQKMPLTPGSSERPGQSPPAPSLGRNPAC